MNEEKTELCLFYKQDQNTVELTINGKTVKSKKIINVLGVTFDSKMQWATQVAMAISKSKKALHAIKLIKKYLTKTETKMLLTSNYYSILYYNSEIWLYDELKPRLKNLILAASACAMKVLNNPRDIRISHIQLHKFEKRALPMDFSKYRLAIQLHKIYNGSTMNDDWIDMNMQQNFNARNIKFHITNMSRLKIGINMLCNRLKVLNGKINLDWLNLSLTSYKLKMKEIFLSNN